MEKKEELMMQLEIAEAKKAQMADKMQAAKEKVINTEEGNKKRSRKLFLKSIATSFGGTVLGVFAATAVRNSVVERYLAMPQNTAVTEEMMEIVGVDTISALREYLLNSDNEAAFYLYEASGARDYAGTVSLEIMMAGLILGGAVMGVPALYQHIKNKKAAKCKQEFEYYSQEYYKYMEQCDALEERIYGKNAELRKLSALEQDDEAEAATAAQNTAVQER